MERTPIPRIRGEMPLPRVARSRTTNGQMFLHKGDGKTAEGRRLRDLIRLFTAAVGPDLTEATRQTVRRAASLALACEIAESRTANGERIAFSDYMAAARLLARLLRELGIDPRSEIPKGRAPAQIGDGYSALDAYVESEYGANGARKRNSRIDRAAKVGAHFEDAETDDV